MGQHTSREHLLLAAQGNCTFTERLLSSFRDTEIDGGLKAGQVRGGNTEQRVYLSTVMYHFLKQLTSPKAADSNCEPHSQLEMVSGGHSYPKS